MKTLITLVVTLVALSSGASSIANTESTFRWGCSIFATSDSETYEQFSKNLDEWIRQSEFFPTKEIGGYMYSSKEGTILWRFVFNKKIKEISVNSSYRGNFSSSQLNTVRKLNFDLWKKLFEWTASQKMNNDYILHDANWLMNITEKARVAYSNTIQP
jgi:hypothetical protein